MYIDTKFVLVVNFRSDLAHTTAQHKGQSIDNIFMTKPNGIVSGILTIFHYLFTSMMEVFWTIVARSSFHECYIITILHECYILTILHECYILTILHECYILTILQECYILTILLSATVRRNYNNNIFHFSKYIHIYIFFNIKTLYTTKHIQVHITWYIHVYIKVYSYRYSSIEGIFKYSNIYSCIKKQV